MKITYIHHSSFFIQQEHACFLFDYWKGTLPEPMDLPLFIFASHWHKDHFDPSIFDYGRRWKEVHWILADDIAPSRIPEDLQAQVTIAPANRSFELSCGASQISFTTLRSTDSGNAYLIFSEGRTIYHAGDLHLWLWGESEADDIAMRQSFEHQAEKLRGMHIDAAFLPLDPRQEHFAYLGLDHVARLADIDRIYPMHFWQKFSIIEKLMEDPISLPYRDKIFCITKETCTDEI